MIRLPIILTILTCLIFNAVFGADDSKQSQSKVLEISQLETVRSKTLEEYLDLTRASTVDDVCSRLESYVNSASVLPLIAYQTQLAQAMVKLYNSVIDPKKKSKESIGESNILKLWIFGYKLCVLPEGNQAANSWVSHIYGINGTKSIKISIKVGEDNRCPCCGSPDSAGLFLTMLETIINGHELSKGVLKRIRDFRSGDAMRTDMSRRYPRFLKNLKIQEDLFEEFSSKAGSVVSKIRQKHNSFLAIKTEILKGVNAKSTLSDQQVDEFLAFGCGISFSEVMVDYLRLGDESQALVWYKRALSAGDTTARAKLASYYSHQGDRHYHRRELEQSKSFYEKSIELGCSMSMFNLGLIFRDQHRFEEAIAWCEKAKDAGHQKAVKLLGNLYFTRGYELYTAQKPDESKPFWVRAAELGCSDAMFNLALIFRDQNRFEEAIAWCEKAKDAGHQKAVKSLGNLYFKRGHELYAAQKLDESKPFWVRAAELGCFVSMYNLGLIFQGQNRFEEAISWCGKAKDAGHQTAVKSLGNLYFKRGYELCTAKRLDEAKSFYVKAAELGCSASMHNLGLIFQGQNRFEEAISWFEKAKDAGYQKAVIGLIKNYINRAVMCLTQDALHEARESLLKADALGGDVRAKLILGWIAEKQALSKCALYWYKKAGFDSKILARRQLGETFSEIGIWLYHQVSIVEAEDFFLEAISLGWADASYPLVQFYLTQAKFEKALSWVEKIESSGDQTPDPRLASFYYQKFSRYLFVGNYGDAKITLDKIAEDRDSDLLSMLRLFIDIYLTQDQTGFNSTYAELLARNKGLATFASACRFLSIKDYSSAVNLFNEVVQLIDDRFILCVLRSVFFENKLVDCFDAFDRKVADLEIPSLWSSYNQHFGASFSECPDETAQCPKPNQQDLVTPTPAASSSANSDSLPLSSKRWEKRMARAAKKAALEVPQQAVVLEERTYRDVLVTTLPEAKDEIDAHILKIKELLGFLAQGNFSSGKFEKLQHHDAYSMRITEEDRLVFTLRRGKVTGDVVSVNILSAKGHYTSLEKRCQSKKEPVVINLG